MTQTRHELWAAAEVCEALGWNSRVPLKRARESGGFPEPIALVSGGTVAVWLAADVRRWWVERGGEKATRAWRKAAAIRMFRRGDTQAEIVRQLKCSPDNLRRWLRDAGEKLPSDLSRETQSL